MKYLILTSILLVLSCNDKPVEKQTVEEIETYVKLEEVHLPKMEPIHTAPEEIEPKTKSKVFIDSLDIGVKKKNKVELHYYTERNKVAIRFYEKKGNKWYLKQELECNQSPIAGGEPQISDFNNDGFNDLTINNEVAARGANEVRQLLIFEKGKLKLIKNSTFYPNLRYNKELNCLDAWLV